MKKVAVIGSKGLPSHTSGLEIYVENLCIGLVDDFEITVFCRKRYCDKIVKNYNGIKIVYVPSINTKHLDAISYSIVATFLAIINGYDIFWYQALGPAITAYIPRFLRKKIVSTVHGLDWKREKFGKVASIFLKMGEKSIVKNANNIIVLNKVNYEYFKNRWNRKTSIISNGVKKPIYRKINIIQKYGLTEKCYILFMSRIVPEKALHILIEAYKTLTTDIKLVIAGEGVHSSIYETHVKEMAVGNKNIIFVGHVCGEVQEELYSNALVYVLPSTVEGQSLGLLEAMSYRLPCIVSDIPENMEVIGDYGFSFEVNNEKELTIQLKKVIANRDKIEEIGYRAQEIISKNYNWEKTIAETRNIFLNLV